MDADRPPVGGLPAGVHHLRAPDAINTSYYVGLMWLDTKLLSGVRRRVARARWRAESVELADPRQPPHHADRGVQLRVQDGLRDGGVYFDGEEIKPLVQGAASFVIKNDGRRRVGVWGRDYAMAPRHRRRCARTSRCIDRQRAAQPRARRERHQHVFGATLGNKALVWRSGVGVDANGA